MAQKLILYNYFRSSASYRVRIALNLKKLQYEYIPVHLVKNGGEQNSQNYSNLNPSHMVPTLVDGDFAIGESMAILDYLESLAPEPRLFPTEPKLRAEVLRFCEVINAGIQPLQNLKINQWLAHRIPAEPKLKDEWNVHWITQGLRVVEELLKRHGGTYCFGGVVTAADCLLIPQVVSSKRFGVDVESFDNIMRVFNNCDRMEAFKEAHPSRQVDAE